MQAMRSGKLFIFSINKQPETAHTLLDLFCSYFVLETAIGYKIYTYSPCPFRSLCFNRFFYCVQSKKDIEVRCYAHYYLDLLDFNRVST